MTDPKLGRKTVRLIRKKIQKSLVRGLDLMIGHVRIRRLHPAWPKTDLNVSGGMMRGEIVQNQLETECQIGRRLSLPRT